MHEKKEKEELGRKSTNRYIFLDISEVYNADPLFCY